MSERWVVNASPLITLAKVGQLDLLCDAGRELVIPAAVAREVLAGPADDAAAAALRGPLEPLVVENADLSSVVEWGLGAGETAVLSIAIQRQGRAVVDDREARKAAAALDVPALGTLAVVILARSEGRIASAAAVLRNLREAGLRLDDSVIRAALARLVGESWE